MAAMDADAAEDDSSGIGDDRAPARLLLQECAGRGPANTDSETNTMHTGHCLCGGVAYRIEAPLAPIQICHCSQCRRAQGTPFATNIPVARDAFVLTSGRDLLVEYESSPGKQRVFCGRCGSPVYSCKTDGPDVRIRAGLLDGPVDARPIAHFHTASRAEWWTIADALPQFPEAYVPRRNRETSRTGSEPGDRSAS